MGSVNNYGDRCSLNNCSLMTSGQDWAAYRKDVQPDLHSEKENLTRLDKDEPGLCSCWISVVLEWIIHTLVSIECCITVVWYICLGWTEDKSTFVSRGRFIQKWVGPISLTIILRRNRSQMTLNKNMGQTLFSFCALWIFGSLSFDNGKHAGDFPSYLCKVARATQRWTRS